MNLRTVLLCTAMFASVLASGAESTDRLGAVGIGVRDLEASKSFYTEVLGLEVLRTYALGDLDEVAMGYPDGTGVNVVLMHWPGDSTRRYDGTEVKLVFYVADPAAIIERIRRHGGKIEREAAPIEALQGTIVGLGRDPDNYLIEAIQR